MRNYIVKIISILFFVFILSYIGKAQESQGGIPRGFIKELNLTDNLPVVYCLPPSSNEKEDVLFFNEHSSESLQFAIDYDVQINIRDSARKDSLDEGCLYRIAIVAKGATSINLFFTTYNVPHGATVYIYNDYAVKGAYTSRNNSKSNKLPIMPIKGDSIVIEYFEPYFMSSEENGLEVGKIYYGIIDDLFDRTSDCQININCPDGDNWQNEKRAVCKIIIGGSMCSGTLLNNTNNDGTPYVLTANHCVSSQNDVDSSVFVFNYESPTCISVNPSQEQSVAGGTLRATYQNSDFTLIELNRRIPSNYHPFFAGWSRQNSQPASGVCIHHPHGRVKKISTHNIVPITSDCMGVGYNPSNFWIIKRWHHGVTEPGSSGSALFNSLHKVIGQLYGGCPGFNENCDDVEKEYSNYGKFNVSWNSGNDSSKRLKEWLDPLNKDTIEFNPLESCDSLVSMNLTLFDGVSGVDDYVAYGDIQTHQTIDSGETKGYIAGGNILFKDGFFAANGSAVSAQISSYNCVVSCPNIIVEQWINYGHLGGKIRYHVLNANYYEYMVFSQHGLIVHSSEGYITSDIVDVWDCIDTSGTYIYAIVFTSYCGDVVANAGMLRLTSSKYSRVSTSEIVHLQEDSALDDLVKIYPNPATNHFNVFVNASVPYAIIIYDSKGCVVRRWDYMVADRLLIDTDKLPRGVYYVNIQIGIKSITKKIVIQ